MRTYSAASTAVFITTALMLLATLYTYKTAKPKPDKQRPTILCTTTILADTVGAIVGDRAHVTSLMGHGIDPHTYRARESDVQKLINADIIIYNGLHLEGKMSDIFEGITHGVHTIQATATIATSKLLESGDFPGIHDPHVWFDVTLWIEVVQHLAGQLQQLHPDNAQHYHNNSDRYLARLRKLDQWVHEQIASIPHNQRILITAHDAFNYFGKQYGITVVGLQGISTDSEPGITDITRIADIIVNNALLTIFVESSVPTRALRAVQNAVRARNHDVTLGDELYSDALGVPTSPAHSYCAMIEYNVTTIVQGLTGSSQHNTLD